MLTTVGIAMVLTTLMGLATGWYLDKWLNTEPWLLLIFLMMGIFAGFWNTYQMVKRYGFKD